MNRVVQALLVGNLLALTVLAFSYPHLMIGPGKLIPGHRQLDAHCFACHAPLTGASSVRCVSCHAPAAIGLRTTTGQPIARPLTSVPFHQMLKTQDCVACHSDHAGVNRFRQHGRFSHALLRDATREQCQSCHKAPADALHQQIFGNCRQCHNPDKWLPATFDHGKFFPLDADHSTGCVTCHARNEYGRYTCYGCHNHTPAGVRSEHIEEGIRDFDNCVACHRSGNMRDIVGGREEGGGERED